MIYADTVLLVTADTLRHDVLADSPADQLPFFDSMKDAGVVFNSVFSTGPGTSSAFPGILASSYPLDHGYRGLTDNHVPVASWLSDQNIRTVGVTASSHASGLFRYDRGFDVFYENPSYRRNAAERSSLSPAERLRTKLFNAARSVPIVERFGSAALEKVRSLQRTEASKIPYERAATITNKTIARLTSELEEHPEERRFVWVHYMEPHAPYYPPDEIVAKFDTGDLSKTFVNDVWQKWNNNRPPLYSGDGETLLTERERRALRLYYRAQVRYLDSELQRLFNFLQSHPEFGETVMFVTSDHGEEFLEHGDLGHRAKLYNELIHVPLLIRRVTNGEREAGGGPERNPVAAGIEVDRLTSHVDLGPTIAKLLGCRPAEKWRGRSFAPLLAESQPADIETHEYVISELSHKSGYGGDVDPSMAVVAAITDNWKYIRNNQTGESELYRRSESETPSEEYTDEHPVEEKLAKLADERLSAVSETDADRRELSDNLREQLHQLGYINE